MTGHPSAGSGVEGTVARSGRSAASPLQASPEQLRTGFAVVASVFVAVHVVLQIIRFSTHDHRLGGLLNAFSLGSDTSIPAYYSALAILFCAVLAFAIARQQTVSAAATPWLGLAVIFAFLSVDEMLAFHEQLIDPVGDALDTSGPLLYAWAIPYGLAGLVFLAVYVPFLRRLPRATARGFVLAGTIFVAGAIGMEMVGGAYFEGHGSQNVTYVTMQTVEEILEMAGIIVFIHALALHAVTTVGGIDMAIAPAEPGPG